MTCATTALVLPAHYSRTSANLREYLIFALAQSRGVEVRATPPTPPYVLAHGGPAARECPPRVGHITHLFTSN